MEVTIKINERILQIVIEILKNYQELYDLTPDWNKLEKERLLDEFFKLIIELFSINSSENDKRS